MYKFFLKFSRWQKSNEVLTGSQPCQDIYKIRCFRDWIYLHHQDSDMIPHVICPVYIFMDALASGCKITVISLVKITAIFEICTPTHIGSLTPTIQANHEYINGANGMRSHITALMMEIELISETSDFINLLTWLAAWENIIIYKFICDKERYW